MEIRKDHLARPEHAKLVARRLFDLHDRVGFGEEAAWVVDHRGAGLEILGVLVAAADARPTLDQDPVTVSDEHFNADREHRDAVFAGFGFARDAKDHREFLTSVLSNQGK